MVGQPASPRSGFARIGDFGPFLGYRAGPALEQTAQFRVIYFKSLLSMCTKMLRKS